MCENMSLITSLTQICYASQQVTDVLVNISEYMETVSGRCNWNVLVTLQTVGYMLDASPKEHIAFVSAYGVFPNVV